MKKLFLIPLAAWVVLAATGCDRKSPDAARKISELERKNSEAAQRQLELEQQIEDQKLAAERDAIERERTKIEEERAALELQQGEAAAAREEAIRKRDAELAEREGKLERERTALAEKQDELLARGQELSDRDRDLAGREALPFEPAEQSAPVGDYGMFYDSLSSYGSWFETPDYGYVWQPVAVRGSGWRPYSRGRWICSDRGWNWVSEEPFGWATYHYGRWALLRGRGWIWVPGSQWAPCWVSWRQSDSHIGWAPLPPETLAYRNHRWDSSVDTQFNIGPLWFNFVGIRDFGGPIGDRCLPVSGNVTIIGSTTNITNIHIENRQVISGGPRYREVGDRIGRPLPFYRLEMDADSRPGRDPMAMRPRIRGNRLTVAAPNLDAGWNEGLKPARIKERIDNITVERGADLSAEITGRYRQSREEGRHQAEQAVGELGGSGKIDQRRTESLPTNGRQGRSVVPDRSPRDAPARRETAAQAVPVPAERTGTRQSVDPRREPALRPAQAVEVGKNPPSGNRARQLPQARPEMAPAATPPREIVKEAVDRRQQEQFQQQQQVQEQVQQHQARQALEAQQETLVRRQQELAQQQQRDQERLAQQAREAQSESMLRNRQEPVPQQPREQPRQAGQARTAQQPQQQPPVRQETGRQRQDQVQRQPEPPRQAQQVDRQRTEQPRQRQDQVQRQPEPPRQAQQADRQRTEQPRQQQERVPRK